MARSLALALHLFLAGGGGRDPAHPRPPRPDGRLVWMHLSPGTEAMPAAQLARRILTELRKARLLVTRTGMEGDAPPDLSGWPPGSFGETLDAQRTGAADAAVAHWQPDVLVMVGDELPPALVVAAAGRGVPLVACDLELPLRRARTAAQTPGTSRPAASGATGLAAAFGGGWGIGRGLLSALLPRFASILVRDHATAERLLRLPVTSVAPVVTGPLELTADAPPCAEAEREAMATLTATRPIWLAAAVPEAEDEAVIAAHAHAMRLAHRMLLVFVPAAAGHAQAVADRMAREGWVVALRSLDQEPGPDVQVLIDDGEGELGLWYRLAPVTYMGGTLSPGGSARSPMEPAALGSAILAGPQVDRFGRDYVRLAAAGAIRALRSVADLADGVAEMIAADRAAQFAHNAWAASSAGIEASDRIALAVVKVISGPDPQAVADDAHPAPTVVRAVVPGGAP